MANNKYGDIYTAPSGAWSLRRYKQHTLTFLIADLSKHSALGIPEDACDIIKNALSVGYSVASALPAHNSWSADLADLLQEFHDMYKSWNDIRPTDPNSPLLRVQAHNELIKMRKKKIDSVLKRVHRIPDVARKTPQLDFLLELDRELIDPMHLEFKRISDAHEVYFPLLSRSVVSYEKIINSPA